MQIKRYLTPFIFGLIGILSFAPFSIKPLIFLSYAYLINGLLRNNKDSFNKLLYWSIGHWGFGMSWLIVSVYYYGNTNIAVSLLIFLLLIAILTLVFSAPLLLLKINLFNNLTYRNLYTVFYVSSIFILNEWSMYSLLNGVPWLIPGVIFLDTISQSLFPILGVAGGSYIIYIASTILGLSWKKNKKISAITLCFIFLLLIPASEKPIEIPTPSALNISIVQPSTNPFLKYEKSYKEKIENNLIRLSQEIDKNTDLVIFPEAELPYAFESREFSLFRDRLVNSKTIITGSWHFEGSQLFNSMVNLKTNQIYNKQHLVPFGEYIPFIPSLRGLIDFFDMPMSNVSHGKDNQANIDFIHNEQKYSISPLICYDIAFGNTVRKSNISSDFIINISNDTWFGNSIGPYHHLSLARVRALENDKWVIRATNDGFSAVISNKGTIVDKLDKGVSGVLNSSIDLFYKSPTPYTTGGYFMPYYLALMLVFISVIVNLCIKRRL